MNNDNKERQLGNLKVYSKIPKDNNLIKTDKKLKIKKILKKTLPILFAATVMSSVVLTNDTVKEVIYLKQSGVSTKNAIYASTNDSYVQPELKEKVEEIDKVLEDRFPNIEFHNSGSTVLSNEKWNNSDRLSDNLAGFYNGIYDVAVYNSNYPERYAHENFHKRTRHTVITKDGKKEEYNGLTRLKDGRGNKLDEALASFIEQDLYGEESCYFESRYLELIFHFIPVDHLVKIAAEGCTDDLEALFAPFFNCDIIGLIDTTPEMKDVFTYGKDNIIEQLIYRANVITDAFYKWVNISEENDEVKMQKIKSYREYLSKNFVNSVSYFDEVFKDYALKGVSK